MPLILTKACPLLHHVKHHGCALWECREVPSGRASQRACRGGSRRARRLVTVCEAPACGECTARMMADSIAGGTTGSTPLAPGTDSPSLASRIKPPVHRPAWSRSAPFGYQVLVMTGLHRHSLRCQEQDYASRASRLRQGLATYSSCCLVTYFSALLPSKAPVVVSANGAPASQQCYGRPLDQAAHRQAPWRCPACPAPRRLPRCRAG